MKESWLTKAMNAMTIERHGRTPTQHALALLSRSGDGVSQGRVSVRCADGRSATSARYATSRLIDLAETWRTPFAAKDRLAIVEGVKFVPTLPFTGRIRTGVYAGVGDAPIKLAVLTDEQDFGWVLWQESLHLPSFGDRCETIRQLRANLAVS